jgi:hypothetical protein
MILDFLWSGKLHKIKYENLIQDIGNGGLKLVDLENKVKSCLSTWIMRMWKNPLDKWSASLKHSLKITDLKNYIEENREAPIIPNKFYNSIFKVWADLRVIKNPDKKTLLNEIIWQNRYIIVRGQPINWRNWRKKGLIYVKDLLDIEENFMSFEELKLKFGIKGTFLNHLTLIKSIPESWKQIIKGKVDLTVPKDSTLVRDSILNFTAKDIYSKLIIDKICQPKCISKWANEYELLAENLDELWYEIFYSPYKSCRDTKLQSLQYRLIYRVVNCQKKLFDWKIVDNPICKFCNNIDDIRHFFMLCGKVKKFWFDILRWWNRISDTKIVIESFDIEECILFGFRLLSDIFIPLNHIILLGKEYIYYERIFGNNNICMYNFLPQLKFKLEIEMKCLESRKDNHRLNVYELVFNEL